MDGVQQQQVSTNCRVDDLVAHEGTPARTIIQFLEAPRKGAEAYHHFNGLFLRYLKCGDQVARTPMAERQPFGATGKALAHLT